MHPDLATLIAQYVAAVERAMYLLEKAGVRRPSSHMDWVINGPSHVALGDGSRFQKHGVGCQVEWPTESVDFDFGPNGEAPTVDIWRLIAFAGDHLAEFGFASEEDVTCAYRAAVAAGELIPLDYANLYLLKQHVA